MTSQPTSERSPVDPRYQGAWVIIVVLVFGLVAACSLTYVYVEGDDATSVAYHALGREAHLQPPYSPYQGGIDLVLGLLPAREGLIRATAMTLSALAAACLVVLMLVLVFDWLGEVPAKNKILLALAALLAIPEFAYLGLVYHPTLIGMCFLLASHLVLRGALWQPATGKAGRPQFWLQVALSAILFGIGGACRWSLVVYGWIVFWDCVICGASGPPEGLRGVWLRACFKDRPVRGPGLQDPGISTASGRPRALTRRLPTFLKYALRVLLAAQWGVLALGAWCVAVAATGYGFREMLAIFRQAEAIAVEGKHWLSVIGFNQTVFTPAALLLGIWGWIVLFRQRRHLAVFALISAAPVLLFLNWSPPKGYLMFVPALLLCLLAGFEECWYGDRLNMLRRSLRMAVLLLLLTPWIVGLRVAYGDTAWGPSFELRPYDREPTVATKVRLRLGAGTAVPTPEGPRSLYGHAAVLFGGEWRRLVRALSQERYALLQTAIRERLPVLVLQGSASYQVCELADLGYTTHDPQGTGKSGGLAEVRRFQNRQGQQVMLIRLQRSLPRFLQEEGGLQQLLAASGSPRVVAYGYPQNLRTLFNAAPAALDKLGPCSAILSLELLPQSAQEH